MLRTLAAAAATLLLTAAAAADQPSFRFDNGLWFNGERFVPATVFVEYGQLRFAKDKKSALMFTASQRQRHRVYISGRHARLATRVTCRSAQCPVAA